MFKKHLYYSLSESLAQPLILFLHGFMGNSHEFDEAIQLLSKEFSFLTVDLPGHGKTLFLNSDEYYTMEKTAHLLINLLNELGISQCFLVGYSMGGRLALYLTLYFPQYFSKVVLESASPGLQTEAERLERVKRDEQIARKLVRIAAKSDFETFLANWYAQPIFGNIKHHPQFLRLLESRLQNNPIELSKSLRFMGTGCQPSLWEKLKENKIPLLLLAGEYDQKFIDINQKMSNICEWSQLKVMNQAGHTIHFENTGTFVENIKQFFLEDLS
jgi:2-succinyl-6-hydroxy-2,4-cyclohexadiene-1-carboxylate synthase